MIAIDESALPAVSWRVRRVRFSLPGAAALAALVLAFGALAARDFAENGLRLASQWTWRFAFFVFFAALVAGPLGRLFSLPRLAAQNRSLVLGFCAALAVYFASVLVAIFLGLRMAGTGALLFVGLGGGIAGVMAASTAGCLRRLLGDKMERMLLAISAIYFWLCYALMGLAHISGPHRPDGFYGLSLCLMVAALLLRFADRFAAQLRTPATPSRQH